MVRKILIEHLQILKKTGLILLMMLIISAFFEQILSQQLELLLQRSEGPGSQLWVVAAGSILNTLFFPTLAAATVVYAILTIRNPSTQFFDFIGRIGNSLYIETVRSWGSSMCWSLLLILPGVVRFFQLTMVPFVVMNHQGYDEGRKDALKVSAEYVQRHWVLLSLVLFVFQFVIPLVLASVLDSWRSFFQHPGLAVFCSAIDMIFLVLLTQILFHIFERTRLEVGDESIF